MGYSKNLSKFAKLAKYLRIRSKEICRSNDCKPDDHKCESYAYLDEKGDLCDICAPDFAQRSYPSLISLPFSGHAKDAKREFENNLTE
jgi:hypothetical protein